LKEGRGGRGQRKEKALRNTPTLNACQIIPQGALFAIVAFVTRWWFTGGLACIQDSRALPDPGDRHALIQGSRCIDLWVFYRQDIIPYLQYTFSRRNYRTHFKGLFRENFKKHIGRCFLGESFKIVGLQEPMEKIKIHKWPD